VDKKKILLIGGALLLGAILLGSRGSAGSTGGGIGSAISGFSISQDPTKKEETIAGGGDVYYNINFPDAPSIVLPPPNFTGNGGYGGNGGRNSFSSISSVPPPTKKEQEIGERGFTSRTGGGELEKWVGGR